MPREVAVDTDFATLEIPTVEEDIDPVAGLGRVTFAGEVHVCEAMHSGS